MSELARVLEGLGVAVFARGADGALRPVEPCPAWGRALVLGDDLADTAPFLADFLAEAEELWARARPGRLGSDAWVQALAPAAEDAEDTGDAAASGDAYLRALATRAADGRCTLVVQRLLDFEAERQVSLQAARDTLLDRQRLLKEIEKKEVLLHCIVHDLKGPLAGMLGSFALLGRESLPPERARELVHLGGEQAKKQQAMIEGLLEVFAAEMSELESFETAPDRAPDLAACAADVVRALAPAGERKGVELVLAALPSGPRRVRGRREPLERVLSNLVENALRHAPAGTAVTVGFTARDGFLGVAVEDRGPGVPAELRDQLFEKFVRGGAGGGTAGLGLYFARITVERWGGSIGLEPPSATSGAGPGARFRFELPLAEGPRSALERGARRDR